MNDNDLNKLADLVDKRINKALEPIKERLDDPKSGLKRINNRMDVLWDQVVKVTADIEDVKDTLSSHSKSLNRIESNEADLGIAPPPELTIF